MTGMSIEREMAARREMDYVRREQRKRKVTEKVRMERRQAKDRLLINRLLNSLAYPYVPLLRYQERHELYEPRGK